MLDLQKIFKVFLYIYAQLSGLFIVTFAISWSVWNYEITLKLLSNQSLADKIQYIENIISSSTGSAYLQLLVYPLLSAIVVISIYLIVVLKSYGLLKDLKKDNNSNL